MPCFHMAPSVVSVAYVIHQRNREWPPPSHLQIIYSQAYNLTPGKKVRHYRKGKNYALYKSSANLE